MLSWMKHSPNRIVRSSPQQHISSSPSHQRFPDLTASPEPIAPDLLVIQSERPSSETSTDDFPLDSESILELTDSAESPLPRFSSSFSPESKNSQPMSSPSDETCPSLIYDSGSSPALSIGRTISRDSNPCPLITSHQEPILLEASTIQHLVGVRIVFDDEWTGFDDLDETEQPEFYKHLERPKKKSLLNSLTSRSSSGKLPQLSPSPSMNLMLSELSSGEPPAPLPASLSSTKSAASSPTKKTSLSRLFQRSKWPASETSPPLSLKSKPEPARSATIGHKAISSSVATTPVRPQSQAFISERTLTSPTVDDDQPTFTRRHYPQRSRSAEPIGERPS